MLGMFIRPARKFANRRIEDENAHIGVGEIPPLKKSPREVEDANAVGLADGPERALPDADPIGMRHKRKLRAIRSQPPILFLDR